MDEQPLVVLDSAECWRLLEEAQVGRLAVAPVGEVDIFPVNFVVHDRVIYFRTAPGSKLFELTVNPAVALEIDGWDDRTAFSVVAKGTAERLESQAEIDEADRLALAPWLPTPKYRWVRITPNLVSGRSFLRGVEPER